MPKKEESLEQLMARVDAQSAVLKAAPELATLLRSLTRSKLKRVEFAAALGAMLGEESIMIMRMIMLGEDEGLETIRFALDWKRVEDEAKKLQMQLESEVFSSAAGPTCEASTASHGGAPSRKVTLPTVDEWDDGRTYIGPSLAAEVDPFEATLDLAEREELGDMETTTRLRRAATEVDQTIDEDISEGIVKLPPGASVH